VSELHLLNRHQELAVRTCRSLVCEWEQKGHDAQLSGDLVSAQLYKQWAFAADLVATHVSVAFSEAFSASLTEWKLQLKDHSEVKLPDLNTVVTPEVLPPLATTEVTG
jgi:hypothetical protein